MTDPIQALATLREHGFAEGQWVIDVRAGRCHIETLSAGSVILTTESGQALDAGTAADFLESYQNGGIRQGEGDS